MESLLFYKRNGHRIYLLRHFSPICSVKEDKKSLQMSIIAKLNRTNNRGKVDSMKLFDSSKLASSYSKGMPESKCCTVREGHCGQVYLLKGSDNYCRKGVTAYPEEQNLCSLLSKN